MQMRRTRRKGCRRPPPKRREFGFAIGEEAVGIEAEGSSTKTRVAVDSHGSMKRVRLFHAKSRLEVETAEAGDQEGGDREHDSLIPGGEGAPSSRSAGSCCGFEREGTRPDRACAVVSCGPRGKAGSWLRRALLVGEVRAGFRPSKQHHGEQIAFIDAMERRRGSSVDGREAGSAASAHGRGGGKGKRSGDGGVWASGDVAAEGNRP